MLKTQSGKGIAVPRASRVRTFVIHGVGDPPEARRVNLDLWLPKQRFQELLDLVQQRDDIRLTFDDGNISDLEIVLPALVGRGLQATFFFCTDLLDRPGFVRSEDLRRFVESGMTIGTHGMHHRSWRRLPPEALKEEIVGARQRLEALTGKPVTKASIPGGAYDRRLLSVLRRAGYENVYTSDGGTARPESWLQPRLSIRRHHDLETLDRILTRDESLAGRIFQTAKRKRKEWR